MTIHAQGSARSGFRHFFFRGLAIVLPSVLTLWILFVVYHFVQDKIADPINGGLRRTIVALTPFPEVSPAQVEATRSRLNPEEARYIAGRSEVSQHETLLRWTRLAELESRWIFPIDLLGLIVAVLLIYAAGAALGGIFGKRLYARGEDMLGRLPLIRLVYPSVKQVTEFIVPSGDQDARMKFNRVIAVEYPRKGIWSIGLVTGTTMRRVQEAAGRACLTVFIPSSPTPFTGYVITIAAEDAVDVPVTIEEALRFVVSGGVIVPPSQMIDSTKDESKIVGDQRAPAA